MVVPFDIRYKRIDCRRSRLDGLAQERGFIVIWEHIFLTEQIRIARAVRDLGHFDFAVVAHYAGLAVLGGAVPPRGSTGVQDVSGNLFRIDCRV